MEGHTQSSRPSSAEPKIVKRSATPPTRSPPSTSEAQAVAGSDTPRRTSLAAKPKRTASQTPKEKSRRRSSSRSDSLGPQSGPSRVTMRQSSLQSVSADQPTYTPTTHRISKAKKGKRVHLCDFEDEGRVCGKVFSRAEHLRRHQLNHSPEALFRCEFSGCSRSFQRPDLLARHMQRHSSSQPPQTEAENVPSTTYQSSAPQGQAAMMAAVTEASSNVSIGPSSTVQPALPNTSLPIPGDSNVLLSPLYIPPGPYPFVPELYSGPSAGSPHLSSADSCHSSGSDYTKVQIATQPYSMPQDRHRSSSIASVSVEPWYPGKSPRSSSSALSAWNELEPTPPLNIYEGSFIQPVGTSNLDYIYHAHRAQMFPEPSVRVPLSDLDGIEFYELRRQLAGAPGTSLDENGLVKVDHEKFHEYLDCYWQQFHPLFPIVHKSTFSGAPPLLSASMIAIGAQFSARPNAKLYANSLHQACSQLFAKHESVTNNSPITDLQTIILMEIFSKHRSRKADIRVSLRFKLLYSTLLQQLREKSPNQFSPVSSIHHPGVNHEILQSIWYNWIELETKRRLLATAYMLDAQQDLLFEQNNRHPLPPSWQMDFPIPSGDSLWDSGSATEWSLRGPDHPMQINVAIDLALTQQIRFNDFQSSLILTNILNRQVSPSGSNAELQSFYNSLDPSCHTVLIYHGSMLARHTRIRDLLAVSGESWILGQKIPPTEQMEWQGAKVRLRTWVGTDDAKKAMWHAVRFLKFMFRDAEQPGGLYEQWTMYLAALVCWAYGFASCSASQLAFLSQSQISGHELNEAWEYLSAMETATSWQSVDQVDTRWRTRGILECVRIRIPGPMGGLLDEAVEVLRKLVEGRSEAIQF
ncbi:MAG: hypothetical protein M1812_007215 [Candelaria pacifica]|nr:MAG: hypothetical protein M1812_007215 [Candelaria pacifica]